MVVKTFVGDVGTARGCRYRLWQGGDRMVGPRYPISDCGSEDADRNRERADRPHPRNSSCAARNHRASTAALITANIRLPNPY